MRMSSRGMYIVQFNLRQIILINNIDLQLSFAGAKETRREKSTHFPITDSPFLRVRSVDPFTLLSSTWNHCYL